MPTRTSQLAEDGTPATLKNLAALLNGTGPFRWVHGYGVDGGEWTIEAAFDGFSDPAPAAVYCLGKRGSCLRDDDGRMSCIEVEITKRLRAAGWQGGWLNTYGGDPPLRWAEWTVRPAELAKLLPHGRARLAQWLEEHEKGSSGIPDVVAIRGRQVIAIECKRSGKDGLFKDDVRLTQSAWLNAAIRSSSLLQPDEFVVLWWTRLPAPIDPPSLLPEHEPTHKYLTGRPTAGVSSQPPARVVTRPAPTAISSGPAPTAATQLGAPLELVARAQVEVAKAGWARTDAAGHAWRPNGRRGPDGTYVPCEVCGARTNPARWPLFFTASANDGILRWSCSTCKKRHADRERVAIVLVEVPLA